MKAPSFPPPDATAAEVAAWHEAQRTKVTRERRSAANRSAGRTSSSCGLSGHRRGDAACPNYQTLGRWRGERRIWRDEP